VRLFVERARFPVVEVTAHDDEQRVRYVDLRAMGTAAPGPDGTSWCVSMRRAMCKRLSSSIGSFCRRRRTCNPQGLPCQDKGVKKKA